MLKLTDKLCDAESKDKLAVFLNGRDVSVDVYLVNRYKDNKLSVNFAIYDGSKIDLYEEVIDLNFLDIDQRISILSLGYPYYFNDNFENFYITDVELERVDEKTVEITVELKAEHFNWKQLWNIIDRLFSFKKNVLASSKFECLFKDWPSEEELKDHDIADEFKSNLVSNGFKVIFKKSINDNQSVRVIINDVLTFLEETHAKTIDGLICSVNANSVVSFFNFPDEIKPVCEQYLIYFTKFLRDIGIDATADIQEKNAGGILFSVTPKDKDQALFQIRDALEIYLNLPRNTSIIPIDVQADINVQQLVSNIYHLKSQLALAAATIQQKELLINQQQSMITNQLLSGEILVKSMEQLVVASQNNEDEKENVIGDIIAVRKADWGFVQVDLPTLMRRLKQVFGKGKDK